MAESSGPSDLRRSNILDLDGGLIQGLFLGPTCVNVTVTLPAGRSSPWWSPWHPSNETMSIILEDEPLW